MEIRKVRKRVRQLDDKHGSSDESDGEDTHHFKHHFVHLAFKDDVFSGFNRECKRNIEYDGGEMSNYAYPGSESSEHDQSFDKTEDHKTIDESLQQSPRLDDDSLTSQRRISISKIIKRMMSASIVAMGSWEHIEDV